MLLLMMMMMMIPREPPVRNQHRHFALVASICIAKGGDQVSFLHKSSGDNPKCPEPIKPESAIAR